MREISFNFILFAVFVVLDGAAFIKSISVDGAHRIVLVYPKDFE